MSKKFDLAKIPDYFKNLIELYGFADENLLSKAVAVRSAEAWYAILFYDPEIEEYFAVDFKFYGGDDQHDALGGARRNGWEIQNDDVGPFASINEFQSTPLTQSFF